MTSAEFAKDVFERVEAKVLGPPSLAEFQMAYQARVAAERVRFAIKTSERALAGCREGKEAALQLLDALDRLESLDRRFQERSGHTFVR